MPTAKAKKIGSYLEQVQKWPALTSKGLSDRKTKCRSLVLNMSQKDLLQMTRISEFYE